MIGISIVMAVWNQLPYSKLAVESILKTKDLTPLELVIIDNGSKDDVKAYFDSLQDRIAVKYIRNSRNLGPIIAINQGIKYAGYKYVMVMHNDVLLLENGWPKKIVDAMENDSSIGIAGLAGRKEIFKTGCVNEDSLKHNLQNEDLNPPMTEEISEVAVVDGLCFVMRREFLDKTKGLDESYGYMHCYDLDISLQSIALGYKNIVLRIEAMHIGNGGITRKTREYKELVRDDYGLLKRNCRILARKWRHLLPLKIP
jgi:GT2 family glycosyltransferase